MKKYYVYIVKCKDKTLYTGYTVDLKNREAKHNSGEGAKYTRHRCPVKMVYSEEFKTINEAMKREAEIKKLSRKDKQSLIKPS